MASGAVPNWLESRTRTCVPPMLVWTIWRKVWPLKTGVAGAGVPRNASCVCGAAVHVPTQCRAVVSAWAVAAVPKESPADAIKAATVSRKAVKRSRKTRPAKEKDRAVLVSASAMHAMKRTEGGKKTKARNLDNWRR